MNKRFGRNDIIFLSLLACLCIAVCVIIYAGGMKKGSYITVTIDGKEYGTYSLQENQTIPVGGNTIAIKNGKAKMIEADCPDQLCIKQKEVCYDKESVICLPNKVVVTVTSEEENELDAVAN